MATLIAKAVQRILKSSRGTLSGYVQSAPHIYGQPRLDANADVAGLLTPERMREICLKVPTPAACVNAILDYSSGVKISIRNVDPSQPLPRNKANRIKEFLRSPNPQENWRRFFMKLARDLIVIGNAAIEIEPDEYGNPANLWVLDAARLKVDFDEHGNVLGYNMFNASGQAIVTKDKTHGWLPNEVIWFELAPISSSLYPISRISQIFSAAMLEDLMLSFIGGRFTDNNIPYGIYNVGDVTDDELRRAVSMWNEQANSNSSHKIILTGSKGSDSFTPFSYHLKDLEARELLNEIKSYIMSVFGVTKNELGDSQDINKSSGYSLSYTFKKRAVEPLLDEICETMTTQFIWKALGMKDVELYYEEIDSRDELLQAEIDKNYINAGVSSINDIRNRRGDPNIEGGDEVYVYTGSAYVPVNMLSDFAQAQYDALVAVVEQTNIATEQAQANPTSGGLPQDISPPMVRGMQEPEKMTTPGGSGSSTTKIKLPISTPKKQSQQPPRGIAQASQQSGMRKDKQ